MKSIRSVLALAFSVLALNSCQSRPVGPMINQYNQMSAVRMQSAARAPQQDLNTLLPVLKEVYKEMADSIQQGAPTPVMDQLLQQNGPAAYRLLGQDASARQQLYPYSDQMVIKEFNKPSPVDNVPPISGPELQALLAKMQPGDVILCGNDHSFVHAALYIGQGKIIHALATQPDMHDRFRGVVEESLATYTARSERDTFVVLRPKQVTGFENAVNFARKQVGKSYDSLFLNATDDRFYCTEFVWKALRQTGTPPRVYPHPVKYGWEMVTVEDFMDSPDMQTIWTRNRNRNPIGQMHRYG